MNPLSKLRPMSVEEARLWESIKKKMKKRYRIFWTYSCRESLLTVCGLIGKEVYRQEGSHCIFEISYPE